MERRLDYQDLDTIEPAPNNPKEHQIDNVRASIDRFGYVAPMIIDDRTGRLVVGHGRLESLKARRDAGETPPEGIQVDDAGRWFAPVIHGWASRSDADAAAYVVADNHLTELGGWDYESLNDLLSTLPDDLREIVSFDQEEIDDILNATKDIDLDELADDLGPNDRNALWPTISIPKCPPHLVAVWLERVHEHNDDPIEAFAALLGLPPELPV
jgi:hypothetical protein